MMFLMIETDPGKAGLLVDIDRVSCIVCDAGQINIRFSDGSEDVTIRKVDRDAMKAMIDHLKWFAQETYKEEGGF